jgi:hypothetical protein
MKMIGSGFLHPIIRFMEKIEIPSFDDEDENITQEDPVKYFQTAKKIIEEKKRAPLIPVNVRKVPPPKSVPPPKTAPPKINTVQDNSPYPTDTKSIFVSNRQVSFLFF